MCIKKFFLFFYFPFFLLFNVLFSSEAFGDDEPRQSYSSRSMYYGVGFGVGGFSYDYQNVDTNLNTFFSTVLGGVFRLGGHYAFESSNFSPASFFVDVEIGTNMEGVLLNKSNNIDNVFVITIDFLVKLGASFLPDDDFKLYPILGFQFPFFILTGDNPLLEKFEGSIANFIVGAGFKKKLSKDRLLFLFLEAKGGIKMANISRSDFSHSFIFNIGIDFGA